MKLHDISVELSPSTVRWPEAPVGVDHEVFFDMARGDPMTASAWRLNSHIGTHVDAPLHVLADGADIARTPLDLYLGPALVVDLPDLGRDVEREDIEPLEALRRHDRVLFKTANSRRLADLDVFSKDYVSLAPSAGEYLAGLGYRLVGVDYQSVERYDTPDHATHHHLLEAGCAILESCDLRRVEPGEYLLVCLPLRLVRGEASPVRAVLVELDEGERLGSR